MTASSRVDNDLAVAMSLIVHLHQCAFIERARSGDFVAVLRAVLDNLPIDARPSEMMDLDDWQRFSFRVLRAMIGLLPGEKRAATRELLRQIHNAYETDAKVPFPATNLSEGEFHARAEELFRQAKAEAERVVILIVEAPSTPSVPVNAKGGQA